MGMGGKAIFAAVIVFAFCASAAHAQQDTAAESSFAAPHGFAITGTHSYLGLNLGRGLATNCPATALVCESRDRSARAFAGTMFNRHVGAEMGYVDTGRVLGPTGQVRAQGLSMSLVGRTKLRSMDLYGKLGTAVGRPDTSVMGYTGAPSPETGMGLAFGGGLSYDFSPSLTARFEWDSYDFRLAAGPVRATSLGLQYRY